MLQGEYLYSVGRSFRYDLLMNMWKEKEVSNEVMEKFLHLATAYEHSYFGKFLENLQTFSAGN